MKLIYLHEANLLEYIKKVGKGWGVFSKKGKNLGSKTRSGKPMTKAQAHKRLGEVEYFKKHSK